MSNALTEFLGTHDLVDTNAFKQSLHGLVKPVAPASFDGSYLKFDDLDNLWTYGAANDVLEVAESEFAGQIMSFRAGYCYWRGREKIEQMAGLGQPPIDYEKLDHDLGVFPANHRFKPNQPVTWDPQMSIGIEGVSGPDNGLRLQVNATGKGLRSCLATLMDEVSKRVEIDQQFIFPIIRLSANPYFNKVREKDSFWPQIEVVGWGDVNGQKAPDTTPKKRQRAKSAPVEETPVRRRRRVA